MTAPCGTLGAYKRHRRKKEPVDGPCQAVGDAYNESRRKAPREIDLDNRDCRRMTEQLEQNPPVIVWRKNNHGVMVHVSIDDPHADKSEARRDLNVQYYDRNELLAEAQNAERRRLQAAQLMRQRAHATPLMTAARTDI